MLIRGDARALPLVDNCVDCVVTSPPYFGLRDYGTATWVGGDPACDHRHETKHQQQGATSAREGRTNVENQRNENFRAACGKCGADRVDAQIGLEPTPDAYVAKLVAVFREVWRVLKDSGTVWLNLGDSYASTGGMHGTDGNQPGGARRTWESGAGGRAYESRTGVTGCKPKDLVGIPWLVAFGLRADGWYLRSDIIWSKPNPMPESVTDRPTKAHEYLFLLTKSDRYYYDAAAIAEPVSDAMFGQIEQGYSGEGTKDYAAAGAQDPSAVKTRIIGNARKRADRFGGNKHDGETTKHSVYTGKFTRNRRTVWTVSTMPYAGAHFATMPEKLVEPCILAGCPLNGCVLDPFVGSGTVIAVAERIGRRGVGVDLSYHDLAKERTAQRGLPFGLEGA